MSPNIQVYYICLVMPVTNNPPPFRLYVYMVSARLDLSIIKVICAEHSSSLHFGRGFETLLNSRYGSAVFLQQKLPSPAI